MEIELIRLLEDRLFMPHEQAVRFVANMAKTELKTEMKILISALRNARLQGDPDDEKI